MKMKKQNLTKRENQKENSILKFEDSKKMKISERTTYVSNCFKTLVVPIVFVLLLSGKINEAIYFSVGCFLVLPVLNQLEKLLLED